MRPSDRDDGHPSTLRLYWREAWALLAFERGRAASFPLALQRWWAGLHERARRGRRLGRSAHRRLMAAEDACRRAGLSFATEAATAGAPWHLPDRLLDAPAAALPRHPLLGDAVSAPGGLRLASSGGATAVDAIHALLAPTAQSTRWRGLPTLPTPSDGLAPSARLAVCLHLFYAELWPELRDHLRQLPEPFDLIVTVPAFANTSWLDTIAADCPQVRFAPMPNRGRDVLPWLELLSQGAFDGYEFVCKLHGKKSPHSDRGSDWRQRSVGALVGSAANAQAVLQALRADLGIGVLGPAATAVQPADDGWRDKSRRHHDWLARRLRLPQSSTAQAPGFFAGTMFWFRPAALRPLAALRLRPQHFAPEMAQTDGTLAHAVERFVACAAAASGYRSVVWDDVTRRANGLAPAAADPDRTPHPTKVARP